MSFKLFYINVIHQLHKVWWFLVRPEGRGVKVILRHGNDILLVQHNYGQKLWTIPGGGVKSKETFEKAARREMKEEMGIEIDNLINIGSYFTNYEYKKVTVECFESQVKNKQVRHDNFEIAQVDWFPLSVLPENRASSVDRIIALYDKVI